MVSLLPTKFHEILFSSFRGVALTNCVTDRRAGQKQYVSHQSGGRHNEYLSQVFTFPKSAKKQLVVKNENIPNTNDNLSEEKSKKIVSHYETVIVKLREELSQQRQLLQKYRCKTRSQENTIVSLRKRVKATKQEKTGNDKFKAKIEDKGVQC